MSLAGFHSQPVSLLEFCSPQHLLLESRGQVGFIARQPRLGPCLLLMEGAAVMPYFLGRSTSCQVLRLNELVEMVG